MPPCFVINIIFYRSVRQIINFDIVMNEYLCPICERLSNSVLPLLPAVCEVVPFTSSANQSFYAWSEKAKKLAANKVCYSTYAVVVQHKILEVTRSKL